MTYHNGADWTVSRRFVGPGPNDYNGISYDGYEMKIRTVGDGLITPLELITDDFAIGWQHSNSTRSARMVSLWVGPPFSPVPRGHFGTATNHDFCLIAAATPYIVLDGDGANKGFVAIGENFSDAQGGGPAVRLHVRGNLQLDADPTHPTTQLGDITIAGSAYKPGGGSWSVPSDVRLKRNVQEIDGALDRLLALRGVTFEYRDPAAIHQHEGTQIGMIAQEVEQVFPDWVDVAPNGYRAVTFRGFEAMAVEALRDLRAEKDAEIAALNAAVEDLQAENESLEARLAAIEAQVRQLATGGTK